MTHPHTGAARPGFYLTIGPFLLHLTFAEDVPAEQYGFMLSHYANFIVPPEQINPNTVIYEASLYPEAPPAGALLARTVMVLDAELRTWAARQARHHGGFMCHAAGVIHQGKSWLLPGRSGAGKSTLALKLTPYCEMVLSDEVCIALPVEGGWKLWGTPFYGTGQQGITGPGSPLQALLFPHRARELGITAATQNEALSLLLTAVVVPDKTTDGAVLDDAMAFINSCRLFKAWFAYRSTPQEVYHAVIAALSS
jgi:hypothetical protein